MVKKIDGWLGVLRSHLERREACSKLARFAYNGFMAWGLDSRARYVGRMARAYGVKVRWRLEGVFLCSGSSTFILKHSDEITGVIRFFQDYVEDQGNGSAGALIRDLRMPFRHTSRETGASIWFNSIPETTQTCRGYFAKGPPRPGEIVFDVGAYCGEIAIAFSGLVGPTGQVFAFEPDELNFEMLKRNVAEQKLENVIAEKKGIAGTTGTLGFYHSGGMASKLVGIEEGQGEKIEVLSFVDACALAGREPDFVKMDVEGAEVDIIRAALPALAKSKTRFAIASYHIVNGQPTSVVLEEMFRSIGYEVETGNPEHQTTWAWRNE